MQLSQFNLHDFILRQCDKGYNGHKYHNDNNGHDDDNGNNGHKSIKKFLDI